VSLPPLLVGNDQGNNVVSIQDRARPRTRKILTERARMQRRENQGHSSFSLTNRENGTHALLTIPQSFIESHC